MIYDIRPGEKRFKDITKFPRGFHRCGDFSIVEAQLLTIYGETLLALEQGQIEPNSSKEQQFQIFTKELREPTTKIEKVWQKYITIARARRKFHTLNGNPETPERIHSGI